MTELPSKLSFPNMGGVTVSSGTLPASLHRYTPQEKRLGESYSVFNRHLVYHSLKPSGNRASSAGFTTAVYRLLKTSTY